MYPITNEVLNLFLGGYRQVADIAFYGLEEELHVTEANIVQNGLSINRYCVTGRKLQIGSVVSSALTLKLANYNGEYNDVVFEGAEMYVRVGIKKWDADPEENPQLHYIPFGYFTVDNAPRKLATITLSALDRMVLFDRPANFELLAFPMTVGALVSRLCELSGITLATNTALLPNHNYSITAAPAGDSITYRQLLSWCCEIMGVCAYIDWLGYLNLAWYTETGGQLSTSVRFNSDVFEEPVVVTGITVKDGNDNILIGEDTYTLDIDQNPLIQHDATDVGSALATALVGFTYTPFKSATLPCPQYWPLDKITFIDKDGNSIPSIITNYTFNLNNGTSVEAKGLTNTRNGYAELNPFTRREAAIIRQTEKYTRDTLNHQINSVLALNELICNSLGVYRTPVEQPDGSIIYYLHDQQELSESSTIFTMTASGIAWTTDGWNGGQPTWSYGVTAAGDALFRMLSAEGINVARAGEDYRIEITPSTFQIYYREMLVTSIQADTMTIPKTRVTEYLDIGPIRFVPIGTIGTNIIFISG